MSRIRRLFARRDERGVTVLEAAVTLLILSIVTVVILDFLDRTSKLTIRTDSQATVEDDTQRVLRTVTQHLRGALPISGTCSTSGFSTSYSDCVRFDVPRGVSASAGCTRVSSFVIGLVDDPSTTAPADEKLLKMIRTEYSGSTCSAGASRTETLLTRVVNPAGQLFTYYGSTGAVIPATSVSAVPKATTVRVSLSVRFKEGAPSILLTNAAALRNNISR